MTPNPELIKKVAEAIDGKVTLIAAAEAAIEVMQAPQADIAKDMIERAVRIMKVIRLMYTHQGMPRMMLEIASKPTREEVQMGLAWVKAFELAQHPSAPIAHATALMKWMEENDTAHPEPR